MGDYQWCCKNERCKYLNVADQDQVDEAKRQGLTVVLICGWCGVGHQVRRVGTSQGSSWLFCLPFEGWEAHVPLSRTEGGMIKAWDLTEFTPKDFRKKYQVDPELYLKWKENRFPRPPHIC